MDIFILKHPINASSCVRKLAITLCMIAIFYIPKLRSIHLLIIIPIAPLVNG